jgi:8-oxo-dGTP pyrophosphatase MutT (NUDIX family)
MTELCTAPAPAQARTAMTDGGRGFAVSAESGLFDLKARLDAFAPSPGFMPPAAVLVPIVLHAEPVLLFTLRSDRLVRHPGQISFPGGVEEAADAGPSATALRELYEETGIAADFVNVRGYLSIAGTATGFAIRPVVGLVREGFSLVPNDREVAGIFEAPLKFFLDPAQCREEECQWQGVTRKFPVFRFGDCRIWGATAAIIADLARRLRA